MSAMAGSESVAQRERPLLSGAANASMRPKNMVLSAITPIGSRKPLTRVCSIRCMSVTTSCPVGAVDLANRPGQGQ